MKGLLFKGFAVGALIAAVAVPAASAGPGVRRRLSVLPLPKTALGPAARSLSLQRDSGVIYTTANVRSKLEVGGLGIPVTPNRPIGQLSVPVAKQGRISGYALDYGLGASGGPGVTEVRTGVDLYQTSADAKKSLARWEGNNRFIIGLNHVGGLTVTLKKEQVEPVGGRRFAFLVSYQAANIAPLFGVDEQFTQGRYEADVTVWAGSAAKAKKLAPTLAKRLDARIKRALAGRLRAKPVQLPAKQKAGPAPGGPDLSTLALQTTDLSGQATDYFRNYWVGPPLSLVNLSGYRVGLGPAGQFQVLQQWIEWFPTANQASFEADFNAAVAGPAPTVDLSSVGDGAQGILVNMSTGSGIGHGYAQIFFSSGQLAETVYFSSDSQIQPSQVQNIAQTVANYINAAGLGS